MKSTHNTLRGSHDGQAITQSCGSDMLMAQVEFGLEVEVAGRGWMKQLCRCCAGPLGKQSEGLLHKRNGLPRQHPHVRTRLRQGNIWKIHE